MENVVIITRLIHYLRDLGNVIAHVAIPTFDLHKPLEAESFMLGDGGALEGFCHLISVICEDFLHLLLEAVLGF